MYFPYLCQICPMKFENETELGTHSQVHSERYNHWTLHSDSISNTNVLFPELDTMFFSNNMYYLDKSEVPSVHVELFTAEKSGPDSSISNENVVYYSKLSNMEIPYEPSASVVDLKSSRNQRKKTNRKQKGRLKRSTKSSVRKHGLSNTHRTSFKYLNRQGHLSIKLLRRQKYNKISRPPALIGADSTTVVKKITFPDMASNTIFQATNTITSVTNKPIRVNALRKTNRENAIEERPYNCDQCGKNFAFFSHLLNHKQIHTAGKVYSCYLCEKQFGFSCMLTQHMRLHVEQERHECESCKKIYRTVKDLKQHRCIIRISEKRPHSCPVCKRTFTRINYLNFHKRCHSKSSNCRRRQNRIHQQD